MVAIGILAVGLLALVQVQAFTFQARKLSQNRILASQRAASEMAKVSELASLDFASLHSTPQTDIEDRMTLAVDVQDNWEGSPSLKGVTVTVTYPSGPNEEGGQVRVWSLVRE